MLAEVGLELRIDCDVGRVVQQQLQLDVEVALARHQRGIQRISLRRHCSLSRRAVGVLPLDGGRCQELAQCISVGLRGFTPVALDRCPAFAESLLVRIAVLRDDRRDALRMLAMRQPIGAP